MCYFAINPSCLVMPDGNVVTFIFMCLGKCVILVTLTRGSLTFPCNDDITQMGKDNDINRVGKAKGIYFLTLIGGPDRQQIHTHRTPHTKNIHTNIFVRIDDVITCPLLVEPTRHRWFPLTWGN